MNIVREHWVTLVLIGLVAATISGWVTASKWEGRAEALGEEAEALSLTVEAHQDMVDAAMEKADSAIARSVRERRSMEARIEELTTELVDLDAINADLEAAVEEELEATDGWVSRQLHEERVAALERTVEVVDSMRLAEQAGRLAELERGNALQVQVGELTAQVGVMARRDSVRVRQIDALERANASGGLLPDFGMFKEPVLIVGGLVIGYLLGGM